MRDRGAYFGSIFGTLGHIAIGLSAFAGGKLFFFLGLILIVLGTGLLKPNISAIVGDLGYVQEQIKAWEAAGVTMMVVGARSSEQIREVAGLVSTQ